MSKNSAKLIVAMQWLFVPCFFIMLWIPSNSSVKKNSVPNVESYAQQIDEWAWVDSTMNTMNRRQKIGQLFMVAANQPDGSEDVAYVDKLIKEYNIGGLIYFKNNFKRHVERVNHYQSVAKVPILGGMDAEWGVSMRLQNTIKYPRQLLLGAIQDDQLIHDMGKTFGRQLKRVGIQISFSPVVDVNNNPNNPVINDRSFGEDKYNVAAKGLAYMYGLEAAGVMACAKHFPGHGDTDMDSHEDLPVISHDRTRLDAIELYPFNQMIKRQVSSIMIAHLEVPALGTGEHEPTTLSQEVVTGLLRHELGYDGLIITDALNMKSVSKYYEPGETDLKAFIAGNDILLFPLDVPKGVSQIEQAMINGTIQEWELDERVRKILTAKYRYGLADWEPLPTKNLKKDLNEPVDQLLKQRLIEQAITMVRDDQLILPFNGLDTMKVASLSFGSKDVTPFQEMLDKYHLVYHFQYPKEGSKALAAKTYSRLKDFDVVLISTHNFSRYASKNFGISESWLPIIDSLSRSKKVVLSVFGSPYSLKDFESQPTIMLGYNNDKVTQRTMAQALFGAVPVSGRLPVTASNNFYYGMGMDLHETTRLKYAMPVEVGYDVDSLKKIDQICWQAIASEATPGCVVWIAKEGKVIYEKAFGYHTYDKKQRTRVTDVYDLASITKIAATTLSLMKMEENGDFYHGSVLSDYLPDLKGTNKQDIIARDIMTHQAGLKPWIPFYKLTMEEDSTFKPGFFSETKSSTFPYQVSSNLFASVDMNDTIYQRIYDSELRNSTDYKYSDLGFYLFKKVVEDVNNKPINDYAFLNYYKPLGLQTMGYNPLDRIPKYRIPPSEDDDYFRNETLKGYVHDMGAAMQDGVQGHAGLFSNANDLGILMQMLLSKGSYGGKTYLDPFTIETYTQRQNEQCRRGLCFDKVETDTTKIGPTSDYASPSTFGHSGFTGTCVWVDPEHELIYIFLSNRTYPKMDNRKLIKSDVRTRIQDILYEQMDISLK